MFICSMGSVSSPHGKFNQESCSSLQLILTGRLVIAHSFALNVSIVWHIINLTCTYVFDCLKGFRLQNRCIELIQRDSLINSDPA